MPLSWGETSKPAFSSALTRKRRMSLSSSARRILCMGFGRLVRVTGSLRLLSPADGKFRVKDHRPGSCRQAAILLHQEQGGRQSRRGSWHIKEAFQGKRGFFHLAGGSRFPTISSRKTCDFLAEMCLTEEPRTTG